MLDKVSQEQDSFLHIRDKSLFETRINVRPALYTIEMFHFLTSGIQHLNMSHLKIIISLNFIIRLSDVCIAKVESKLMLYNVK